MKRFWGNDSSFFFLSKCLLYFRKWLHRAFEPRKIKKDYCIPQDVLPNRYEKVSQWFFIKHLFAVILFIGYKLNWTLENLKQPWVSMIVLKYAYLWEIEKELNLETVFLHSDTYVESNSGSSYLCHRVSKKENSSFIDYNWARDWYV